MTLTECKEFMRLYQRGAEGEQYNWRTTARWALRHKWAQEENGQLRDALAAARDELASMTVRMQIAEDGRQIETRRAERALDTLARYEQQQWMARARTAAQGTRHEKQCRQFRACHHSGPRR